MAKSRRPKNVVQAQFFEHAVKHGWELTSRGWPTYFLQRAGKIVAVEVLSSKGRNLRQDKERVMRALMAAGIECFVWSPDGGFTSLADSGSLAAPRGERGDVVDPSTTEGGTGGNAPSLPFDAPLEPPSRDGNEKTREAVDAIWGCFVLHMKPSSTLAGEEERKIIRAALKVATVKECCEAIEGCRASDYHMGDNPRGRKYNTISHILRGKRGKRTTREQIDMLRDIRDKAVATGHAVVTSIDPALVAQRKNDVRRGFQLKGDAEAQQRAEAAEKWLTEHGIPTERRPDGYPIWGSGGNA